MLHAACMQLKQGHEVSQDLHFHFIINTITSTFTIEIGPNLDPFPVVINNTTHQVSDSL